VSANAYSRETVFLSFAIFKLPAKRSRPRTPHFVSQSPLSRLAGPTGIPFDTLDDFESRMNEKKRRVRALARNRRRRSAIAGDRRTRDVDRTSGFAIIFDSATTQ